METLRLTEVDFKETKKITSVIAAYSGSFALDKDPLRFESCRERFATMWNANTEGLFFKHDSGQGQGIAAFIRKTEQIVHQTRYTQFALTNKNSILWIEPSKFWMRCRMRRSLFTILLRSGRMYRPDADNYEEALFSDVYIARTRYAVMRFLYGFTRYTGERPSGGHNLESRGWDAILAARGKTYFKQHFHAPKRRSYSPMANLQDEIWI